MKIPHSVKFSAEQGHEINVALMEGDTERLFKLLVSYLDDNDFSLQDAASALIKSRKLN